MTHAYLIRYNLTLYLICFILDNLVMRELCITENGYCCCPHLAIRGKPVSVKT